MKFIWSKTLRIYSFLFSLLLLWPPNESVFLKLIDLRCKARNERVLVFELCRVQHNSNSTQMNMVMHLVQRPITRMMARVQLFRKQFKMYVPFFLDANLDWCEFMEKRENKLIVALFGLIKDSTNFDKPCAAFEEYLYANVTMPLAGISLPFTPPNGDYRADITAYVNSAGLAACKLYALVN